MGKSLTSKAGIAIWRTLGPKTKWRLVKACTPILTAALMRSANRNSKNLLFSGAVLAGAIIGILLFYKKSE
jgi:hypothetical protein